MNSTIIKIIFCEIYEKKYRLYPHSKKGDINFCNFLIISCTEL